MKLPFRKAGHVPVILQAETSECGLACLCMVLNHYGHIIDINSLRARCSNPAMGATLTTLMQLADRMQLTARPLRLELQELPLLRTPAILHWDMKHFVVLARIPLEPGAPIAGAFASPLTREVMLVRADGVIERLPVPGG